ncbi:MAG: hypothetical protein DMG65_04750 [Candidatus Angelobacter sp. Gp1-AA117]|nr:MAG: hypothetical protein DMG65_04750 [Candidatus Angelobacter sp. Gp1-AA117]
MSRTNKKLMLAYVFLVVLPLLGLAGILNYGRRLVAPISVDGVWHFEIGSPGLAGLLCVRADEMIHDGSVTILQSGKVLSFNVGGELNPAAMGSIEGDTITASTSASSRQGTGCGGDHLLILTATVARGTDPRYLAGVLNLTDCASCVPVAFHASRQARATTKVEN